MKDAKPCPFCKSSSLECDSADYTDDYFVFCFVCFTCGPQKPTKKEAWVAWNLRRRFPVKIEGV